jgi:cell division protein ZapA (FtsZ GTPase activity inhibitor)
MLDVHAPEHRISGLRDFFVHLATITVGLLIALMLENAAEAWHHRHQRIEAQEKILQEIRENRDLVTELQKNLNSETQDLVTLLAFFDARLAKKPYDLQKLSLGLRESPLKDAAWRSAATTGVVSYMDYSTVEAFSDCYKEQDQYEHMEEQALSAYLRIESFVATKKPTDLSDDEMRQAQPVLREALANLGALRDIGRGTADAYDQILKK